MPVNAAQSAATEEARALLGEDLGIFDAAPETGEQTEQSAEAEPDPNEGLIEALGEEEIPEDILALVETPDFEAEADVEVESYLAHEAEEATEDYDLESEWDPEKKELLKKLRAAEKKAEFYEGKRVESERGKWQAEADKYFPYADTSKIQATSRRGFLRAASAEHNARKAEESAFAEKLRPSIEAKIREEFADATREQIRAELKEELAAAWGRPVAGAGVNGVKTLDHDEAVDKAFRTKGLAEGIKEMFKNPV